jgi:hypothetical protein
MTTEPTRDPWSDPTSVTLLEYDTVPYTTNDGVFTAAVFNLHRLKFGVAPDVYRVSVTDVRADKSAVDTLIGNYPDGIPTGGYDTARSVYLDWIDVERRRRR